MSPRSGKETKEDPTKLIHHPTTQVGRNKERGGENVLSVSKDKIVRYVLSLLRKGKIGLFCNLVRMVIDKNKDVHVGVGLYQTGQ
jgi:hypothetical protein